VTLRAFRRAVALVFALAECFLSYWFVRIRGRLTPVQRAQWLHRSGSNIVRALGIRAAARGRAPAHGLVVANHLSYLDIMIFSAIMPCFFVSKAEIARWPYFGKAARAGGTIFIDRGSRASTAEAARQIAERLKLPVPVLLFPEGTSSDGSQVLRFHSSLFEPAVTASAPITAAAIRYVPHDGSPERDLCWFDDTLFLPHLWRVLRSAGFTAEVTFGEARRYPDRRSAAEKTHDEVVSIRAVKQLSDVSHQLSGAAAVAENS
jgi:1-acyl-sn-glycerol-3-phosphate acyltransferase